MSEKHPGGRPRGAFDSGPLSIRLSASLHDALIQEAYRREVDVSQVIREGLASFVVQNSTKTPQPR